MTPTSPPRHARDTHPRSSVETFGRFSCGGAKCALGFRVGAALAWFGSLLLGFGFLCEEVSLVMTGGLRFAALVKRVSVLVDVAPLAKRDAADGRSEGGGGCRTLAAPSSSLSDESEYATSMLDISKLVR